MDEHLQRALELAERGRGTTHPNPVVGAVVLQDGDIVGEGWHERAGGPHAEVIALEAAGERARGSTLTVTMEPCAHHGRTPPCVGVVLAAGVHKIVAGCLDPGADSGGGLEQLRGAGVEVELVDAFECRAQNEAWRTWVTKSRPFVTYKVAMTLDGRVSVPRSRWVSGEESRRLVHELRAGVDAVAVGMGTVRVDDPQLDARGVEAVRQPRRLAFGSGPLPDGSPLELRSGPLEDELDGARCRRRSVDVAGGRPDARHRLSRAGIRRQAPRLHRPAPRRCRPVRPRRAEAADAVVEDRRPASRR